MIVGIIGSGGREHAICAKIKESAKISKIFCIPGNAGTSSIAENINIKINDFKSIKDFCIKNQIELLIVGPEQPLVDGIVDYFLDTKIKVFGPNKVASQLEGSKIFTKKICAEYKIPTANFKICENIDDANKKVLGSEIGEERKLEFKVQSKKRDFFYFGRERLL